MLTFKQRVVWIILHIFWFFPIKKNRIAFICYTCTQYSCNPKYLSEYLEKNYPGKYEIVWYYRDEKVAGLMPSYVNKVKKNSIKYFYTVMTSELVISNVSLPRIIPFRKKQCKVNTWHGTAFKGDNNKHGNNYNLFDYFIAENELTCRVLRIPDSFNFRGEIKKIGMPRNDILIVSNPQLKEDMHKELGISLNKKLLLYAPTFRDTKDTKAFDINFFELQNALTEKFGGEWTILFRYHHMQEDKKVIPGGIDVGDYPDMQRLMVAADVLITDYSSVMWDFSLTNKPVFLYAVDVEQYVNNERGEFFYPYNELPFSISKSNDELRENILSFEQSDYDKAVEDYHKKLGRFNYNGDATEKFVQEFLNVRG